MHYVSVVVVCFLSLIRGGSLWIKCEKIKPRFSTLLSFGQQMICPSGLQPPPIQQDKKYALVGSSEQFCYCCWASFLLTRFVTLFVCDILKSSVGMRANWWLYSRLGTSISGHRKCGPYVTGGGSCKSHFHSIRHWLANPLMGYVILGVLWELSWIYYDKRFSHFHLNVYCLHSL